MNRIMACMKPAMQNFIVDYEIAIRKTSAKNHEIIDYIDKTRKEIETYKKTFKKHGYSI